MHGATATAPSSAPGTADARSDLERTALRAFRPIKASGVARTDPLLAEDGVVDEIDTMPGFAPRSMLPVCWQESGSSSPELITELVELAR